MYWLKKSLHRLLLCESSKIRILFLDDTQIKSLRLSSLYVFFPVPASFYKDAADSELTSMTSIWEWHKPQEKRRLHFYVPSVFNLN